jgi:PIN domain nuclease of toxin-antitoxin system
VRRLIDTHTLIWAVDDPSQLGPQASIELQDPTNELLLSAGAVWELAIKVGLNKLVLSMPYREWMTQAISDLSLTILPITWNTPKYRQDCPTIIETRSTAY